jgi:hypothetical protein
LNGILLLIFLIFCLFLIFNPIVHNVLPHSVPVQLLWP